MNCAQPSSGCTPTNHTAAQTQTKGREEILKIRGLTKQFRHGTGMVEAVSDVTISLQKGEMVAVMGASGSGKSTLLHLTAGLTRPDAGTIHINGTDMNTMNDRAMTLFRREHIGLIFQSFNLIPSLTSEENIGLPLLLSGKKYPLKEIHALMDRLGLRDLKGRGPDAMSGGEQQRVAIARALICNPGLILADEPTGSLDSRNGRKLCELFATLCKENNTTVLMVTHNPVVAFAASRFIILKDGKVVGQLCKQDKIKTVQDLTRAYLALTEGEGEFNQ